MTTDLLIVWAPGIFTHHFINSVPVLIGYARSINLKSCQVDASIGFERYLISNDALKHHRPRRDSHALLANAWKIARRYAGKYGTSAYRHGHMTRRHTCLSRAASYYSARYSDTLFTSHFIYLRRFSFERSTDIIPAAHNLAVQRNHPLTRYYRKKIIPIINRKRPAIIGISVANEYQIIPAMLLATLTKSIFKSCHITIGGAWPSRYREIITQHPGRFFGAVDSYAIDDGEPVISGFKKYLEGKCGIDDINNLLLPRRRYNRRAVYVDIRRPPIPVFSQHILNQYPQPVTVPIEVSRGCYWGKCAFCTNKQGIHSLYRIIDVDYVVKTMEQLSRKYGIKKFFMGTLAMNPAYLGKFISRLQKSKMRFKWVTWIRFDKDVSLNLLLKAFKYGCTRVGVAPESLTQRTLDLMKKGYNARKTISLLDKLQKQGHFSSLNIIAGFPGEPIEDFENTLKVCRKHRFCSTISPFRLEYASDVLKNRKAYGITIDRDYLRYYDLSRNIHYKVKRGIPTYSWYEVRSQLAHKYKSWFMEAEYSLGGYDTFEFHR